MNEICNLVNLEIEKQESSSVNFGKTRFQGAEIEGTIELGGSEVIGNGAVNFDREKNFFRGCKPKKTTNRPFMKKTASPQPVKKKVLSVLRGKKKKGTESITLQR